jgi:membrane-bound metal-dependent hydrolase YbcI (DUF457 family)
MYAAHFAAALAIKGQAPKVATWALLAGAFLPDFLWIAFGLAGIEPSQGRAFFDDWSHSLAMVLLWATLFALLFWRRGLSVTVPIWLAVLSHFLLDLPIHPKNLALYPHSSVHIGWSLWESGARNLWFATRYWWVQLAVLVVLSIIYAFGARKMRAPRNLIYASCIFLVGLHFMTL